MKLHELKALLADMDGVSFTLPDGSAVPSHFHVTEVGQTTKHFIDCGGTLREEHSISMQLWQSVDYHHRLKADKLAGILSLAEEKLSLPDVDIEVEYQGNSTIERYALGHKEGKLQLTSLQTACLASDVCQVVDKVKPRLSSLVSKAQSCCTPDGGCC